MQAAKKVENVNTSKEGLFLMMILLYHHHAFVCLQRLCVCCLFPAIDVQKE